jgi:hypothetical protein
MTYSVYQHWDPLKVCVVGRSYPPEFYSWITVPHVRKLFERIAIETEEDYQAIIKKLQSFGVKTLRPNLPTVNFNQGKFVKPPMIPRDFTIMIGKTFYNTYNPFNFGHFYFNWKKPGYPECQTEADIENLPSHLKLLCKDAYKQYQFIAKTLDSYDEIFTHIDNQGNKIKSFFNSHLPLNGAMVTRIGKDLYFGTQQYGQGIDEIKKYVASEFHTTRNHVIDTGGHSDGTYCPVCPGLIISLRDVPTYADTFPDWEVVYLPRQGWEKIKPFTILKEKNKGKWWIPGFEYNDSVINVVETWLSHWTGYVEETVFDVNMLIIDPKNVMVFGYNKQVFDALDRYGITPHIVPFRHRYFWDGGIHCVTSDLHREGEMQDYFFERNQ